MKKNLKNVLISASYSSTFLNKKVVQIQKSYQEVKKILNPK